MIIKAKYITIPPSTPEVIGPCVLVVIIGVSDEKKNIADCRTAVEASEVDIPSGSYLLVSLDGPMEESPASLWMLSDIILDRQEKRCCV